MDISPSIAQWDILGVERFIIDFVLKLFDFVYKNQHRVSVLKDRNLSWNQRATEQFLKAHGLQKWTFKLVRSGIFRDKLHIDNLLKFQN